MHYVRMFEKSSQGKHARYFEKIEMYISNVLECSLQPTCRTVVYFQYTESEKEQKKLLLKPTEQV